MLCVRLLYMCVMCECDEMSGYSYMYTVWSNVYTVWSYVYTVWSNVYTVWSNVYTVWSYLYILYGVTCILYGVKCILYGVMCILYGILCVYCMELSVYCMELSVYCMELCIHCMAFSVYTVWSNVYTVWSYVYTVWHSLCILYGVMYTLYGVMYILYGVTCILYGVTCILYGVMYTLYGVMCILYGILCILYGVMCILYGVMYILYGVMCILYVILCILYVILCILYGVMCILYVILCILYGVMCILYVILCILYGVTCMLYSVAVSHRGPQTGWHPLDCQDIWERGMRSDGEYTIYLRGSHHPLPVYCDMTTNGKAWTVVQKRFDGSEDFNQDWQNYLQGFGKANEEYWLGLQNIYRLTMQGPYELRVEMEDMEGAEVYAQYLNFSLSPHALNAESDGYKLHVDGFTDGGAGDILGAHVGQKFSTYDKDQDDHIQNCAEYWGGGFWYESLGCADATLNARYMLPKGTGRHRLFGFSWNNGMELPAPLRSSQMKMRRLQEND
uniref:Fibrinogen C-terminal domain-containing protein n=1 Tax=Leptobrachium leishanense TaxID=445787 RepID=A0A8C5RAM6_9ANUR